MFPNSSAPKRRRPHKTEPLMTRYDAFLALSTDHHYVQHFRVLTEEELNHCAEFLSVNEKATPPEFSLLLHKRLIDPRINRTKNHILIDELLAVANQISKDGK
jgi:hypothetical protein